MTTIAERVAKGVEWLDATRPGWVDRIDLSRLDMISPCDCVIGQEIGNYNIFIEEQTDDENWGFRHGFHAAGSDRQFNNLRREWVRVITSRREATPDA